MKCDITVAGTRDKYVCRTHGVWFEKKSSTCPAHDTSVEDRISLLRDLLNKSRTQDSRMLEDELIKLVGPKWEVARNDAGDAVTATVDYSYIYLHIFRGHADGWYMTVPVVHIYADHIGMHYLEWHEAARVAVRRLISRLDDLRRIASEIEEADAQQKAEAGSCTSSG